MVGEHIRALKGGRWVHAIDCGDETVLHLAEDSAPPRVRRAYRPEFVAGAESVEHVTHRERTFPPREVVRRAYSRAADPTLAQMFHDSEAFAGWCTTGRLSVPRNDAVLLAPDHGRPAAPGATASAAPTRPPREAKPRRRRSRSTAKRAKPARKVAKRPAAARAPKRTSKSARGKGRGGRVTAPKRGASSTRAAKATKRKARR
jgi:hypothetical protein